MHHDLEDRLSALERVDEVGDELRKLRQLSELDVAAALNKVRFVLEKILQRVCLDHGVSWGKSDPTIESMVGPLVARSVLPKNIAIHVRTVQANASPGSHFQSDPLSPSHLVIAMLALVDFLHWYYGGRGLLPANVRRQSSAASRTPIAARPG